MLMPKNRHGGGLWARLRRLVLGARTIAPPTLEEIFAQADVHCCQCGRPTASIGATCEWCRAQHPSSPSRDQSVCRPAPTGDVWVDGKPERYGLYLKNGALISLGSVSLRFALAETPSVNPSSKST
jgi:hypothetical protein